MLRDTIMMIFTWSLVWDIIREPPKTLTSLAHISVNIERNDMKLGPEVNHDLLEN